MNKKSILLSERNRNSVQKTGEYISSRVIVDKTTQCWNWVKSIGNDGYGKAKRKGKTIRAHRLSYTFYKGEIPEGMFVCHSCDNPKCVNPEHLWLGSHYENEIDKTRKGRRSPSPGVSHPHTLLKGEAHPKSKISDKMAEEIYILGLQGFNAKEIKLKLGLLICDSSIQRIISGKSWKHLQLDEKHGLPLPQNIRKINASAKLTAQSVIEIRASQHLSVKELSHKYGVSPANISCILKRKSWNHI
ncbi:HNH endonuclease signature motif containing protein [Laspinema olomoucense]|uniref:HNH endonuclease signature motif containing protein n=1 Tax=Laspinema olomoucense TaxID=3231600 RepID=UPI0021BAB716|nr:HNH endonuclease signature motif containing protein [Laspinema sp. D3d]MCT7971173.1 HNH endonuclease [Laspinema sp. D3d]